MSKRTILQKGTPGGFLFVFAHIGPDIIRKEVAALFPDATVVVELWGEGTGAYTSMLPSYGGSFKSMVDGIIKTVGYGFSHVNLTTWSAGSQVAKMVMHEAWLPNSLVMLDGLYGSKAPGTHPDDGTLVPETSDLSGIIAGVLMSAKEEAKFSLMATHSNIMTPYASSKECWNYSIDQAMQTLGTGIGPDLYCNDINGRKFTSSRRMNKFQLYGFPGNDAAEHCAHAHMYKVFWQRLMQGA